MCRTAKGIFTLYTYIYIFWLTTSVGGRLKEIKWTNVKHEKQSLKQNQQDFSCTKLFLMQKIYAVKFEGQKVLTVANWCKDQQEHWDPVLCFITVPTSCHCIYILAWNNTVIHRIVFIDLLHSQFQRMETKASKFQNLVLVVYVFSPASFAFAIYD